MGEGCDGSRLATITPGVAEHSIAWSPDGRQLAFLPAAYSRSSPITFIKRARTPTLVLVGERGLECPVPQSREFYHALKTLGVATQMVVYPGEGHMISRPEHRRDVVERTVAWFDRYPGAGGGATGAPRQGAPHPGRDGPRWPEDARMVRTRVATLFSSPRVAAS